MTASAQAILRDVAELALPPERLTVPEAAARHVVLDVRGGYYGEWDNSQSPLMVEPAECLTSRAYDAVIMVAPAQTGKTQALVDNWAFYTICVDQVDFLLVEKSEAEARKHSKTKFDRSVQASPDVKSRLLGGHGSNVHEKKTKSGAYIWLKWPTKNTLSGATISRIALTDYDRMPDDIDGEGPAFDLAYSRRTYFGSRGMVLAESSPSKPILDPMWTPGTPHEAPPTIGILGLYNTGDRRRVYSRCPHCEEWISPEASPESISYPEDVTDRDAGKLASLICPANGCLIGQEHEHDFKRLGRWVREGQTIHPDGSLGDDGLVARRASFWIAGWFAAFASWQSIFAEYHLARRQFERSGDEESLKGAVNTKIGGPYWTLADRNAAEGKTIFSDRTSDSTARFHVPEGARVIMGFVDIQKRSFEVGVIARGPDGERWIIDRYGIIQTQDEQPISPATHLEHWEEIQRRVIRATYRLPDGLELRVHAVGIDSGGAEGVTERAYEFWRSLPRTEQHRTFLIKGISTIRGGNLTKLTRPDSRGRKDRPSGGRGDVPVLEIMSNRAKDAVHADLARSIPGRGYIHIPDWLAKRHLDELQSEIRDDKGRWQQVGNRRNELWDHLYYEHGLWHHLSRGDNINWKNPPSWLAPMNRNPNVVTKEQRKQIAEQPKKQPRARRAQPPPRRRLIR